MWTRRAVLASGIGLVATSLLPARSLAVSNQLRAALAREPPHLDPTAAGADASTMAVCFQNLFEGLTRLDEKGKVLPNLASSWTISPDGLSYVFSLETTARYHDGTSFDADHAVFSLNRIVAPQGSNPQKALFASIGAVTAVDPATLRVVLKAKDAAFLYNLGRAEASMVAPESADNNARVPIGTGPFALTEWEQGDGILLERNEDYWGVHPRLNEVSFIFVPDADAAIAALLARQLDAYPEFPDPAALAPLKGNASYRIVVGKGPDGPRTGVWNKDITGMWVDAPVEGCVLSGLRWAGDTGMPEVGPAPFITNAD